MPCIKHISMKRKGVPQTHPSVSLQLKGWDAELPLLLWDVLIIWIFFLPYDIWEICFPSNSLHPFLQLPLLSTEHSSTPRNRFTTGLHPALRAVELICTEPLCVSAHQDICPTVPYLSIKVRRSCSLYLEAPCLSYILIKYLKFPILLNFYLFQWLSNFLLWKDKISIFFLSKFLEHAICMVSFCVFIMLKWVFHSQKNMDFKAQGEKVWHIFCNDGLLDKYAEESFLNLNYSDLKEFIHDGQ